MSRKFALQIGGREISTLRRLSVTSPFDGVPVAEVSLAGSEEMAHAAESAAEAFRGWKDQSPYRRAEILGSLAKHIKERREELAGTIVAEAGKPVTLARGEVDRAVNTFSLAAEEAKRIGGEVIPVDLTPDAAGRIGITSRFPRGPVAAITPYNFPLNLVAHKVAPALACGCTVVLKPAPQAPVSSLLLGEMATAAGLPSGVLNVLPAGAEETASLVTDPRIRMVSFTGSAEVGWRIRSQALGKKVLLELGGNAAALVEPDAPLEFAARRIALGSFAYAGQICISVQHVLVHRAVMEKFRTLFLAEVRGLPAGDPRDEKTVVGPLISEASAARVEEWVREAVEAGARVLCGGGRKGPLMEPTVLEGTDAAMKVGCREIFGPVATLDSYDDFDEALERANSSAYGLQAGIFTGSLRRAFQAFRGLEVGGVIVNDYPTFRVDHMPYGGVKASGLGREGVRYAIEEMTEPRLLILNLGDSP